MRYRRRIPHTAEDTAVWLMLRARWPQGHSAYIEFMFGDRHDADLMWYAQRRPLCPNHWRSGLTHLILLRGPRAGERLEWLG